MPAPIYPQCLCRTCGQVFLDWLDLYPGPATCFNCQTKEREARRRKARRR
jgi:hypothetical protein